MRLVLFVSLAIGLSACTKLEIDAPPTKVTPNQPARAAGIDVYAGARRAGNPVPQFRGQTTVEVRSFTQGNGPGRTEVAGAICQITGTEYSATVQTPATLIVPDYGPNSPAIFARCTRGQLTGTKTVTAANETQRQRNRRQSSIGVGVGDGFDGGGVFFSLGLVANLGPRGDDVWAYPDLAVPLR